jgi:putative nucleotidyltransferase with HDIG domain
MENRLLYESMYSNITDTFRSLIASIHLRDRYTQRHSSNVTELAAKTAEALHCSEKEIESIRIAGMFHDIGKIAIPDNILLKKDRLTEEEYTIIKEHPAIGEYILKSVALMDSERKIILHHHERWDGRGYPDGLSGNEIPLLSRILSVVDSFDAMMSNRPYRDALGIDTAIDELKKNSESQFDKNIVGAFISAYCGSC